MYVFLPLKRLYFYKRQGIKTAYFPVLGMIKFSLEDLDKRGDFFAGPKASSKADIHQKIFVCNLGSGTIMYLRDPLYVKEFLQKSSQFRKAKSFDLFKLLIGDGLLFSEGETWKMHRKVISSCFHYEFIKNNVQLIHDTTQEFFEKITPSDMKEYPVMNKIQEITGEIVGRMFFGKNLGQYTYEGQSLPLALAHLMAELGEYFNTTTYLALQMKAFRLPIPSAQKLLKRIKEFRAQCSQIINDRKDQNRRCNDLLDALLAQQATANSFSDEDIVNEFITFFATGMDTTAQLITMALYNLTKHQEYKSRLEEERRVAYNQSNSSNIEALQSMSFMTCFLKETLRHFTPSPVTLSRESEQDVKLIDVIIRKGTLVEIDFFSMFFSEKHFEKAEEFRPEIWEDPNLKIDPYAFIPFSAGSRNCIGQNLAMVEAKIIISEFLERFEFKLEEEYKLKMTFRFVYEPLDALKFELKKKDLKSNILG